MKFLNASHIFFPFSYIPKRYHGSSGNRIIAMAAPRTATCNTFHGKNQAFTETILPESLQPILRTRGDKSTTRRKKRRNNNAIEHDQTNSDLTRNRLNKCDDFIVWFNHGLLTTLPIYALQPIRYRHTPGKKEQKVSSV